MTPGLDIGGTVLGRPRQRRILLVVAASLLRATALAPWEAELIAAAVAGAAPLHRTTRLRALAFIATKARSDVAALGAEDAAAARDAGATDREVRDAMLIGTAFWLVA